MFLHAVAKLPNEGFAPDPMHRSGTSETYPVVDRGVDLIFFFFLGILFWSRIYTSAKFETLIIINVPTRVARRPKAAQLAFSRHLRPVCTFEKPAFTNSFFLNVFTSLATHMIFDSRTIEHSFRASKKLVTTAVRRSLADKDVNKNKTNTQHNNSQSTDLEGYPECRSHGEQV